jgi:hypothetical protein
MAFDGLTCTEVLFRSTEVTRIVGMQQDILRLWRSRGHLPKKKGRGAVYTGREIAEIMVRHELSNYGIAPAKSASIGNRCASSVIRLALLNHPSCCEIAGPKGRVEALQRLHRDKDALATYLSKCETGYDFVVRRDGEEAELVNDIPVALDERRFKSAMVLNLQKCAEILVESSGATLFTCEYPKVGGEQFVRMPLGTA